MYAIATSTRQRDDRERYRRDTSQALLRGKEVYAPSMSSPYFYEWLVAVVGVTSLERPVRMEYDERSGQHVAMIEGDGE